MAAENSLGRQSKFHISQHPRAHKTLTTAHSYSSASKALPPCWFNPAPRDEIADSPPGAVEDAATRKIKEEIKSIGEGTKAPIPNTDASGTIRYATVKDGKAEFETPKVVEAPKV
jgi:hypothetical protein